MWKFCYDVLIQNGVSVEVAAWKAITQVCIRVEEVGGYFFNRDIPLLEASLAIRCRKVPLICTLLVGYACRTLLFQSVTRTTFAEPYLLACHAGS